MRTESVILPSGAAFELRALTLSDENYLTDAGKRRKKGSNPLVEIVGRCTLQVVDPGPYPFLREGEVPKWGKLLRGDFWWALLELRAMSYREGDTFDMMFHCAGRTCTNRWEERIKLREDLLMIQLSKSSAELLRSNTPHETAIDDRKVTFRLPTCDSEDEIERMREKFPGRGMACNLRSFILDVEGVERREIMDWLDGQGARSKWPGLTSADAEDLRAAFDAEDCGVDTTVHSECPRCGADTAQDLPFDRLLLPGTAARKAKPRTNPEENEGNEENEATPEGDDIDNHG
jgi:hypothetical protein